MTDFGISTQPGSDGAVRIVLRGEVDMATAEQIGEATDKALATDHPAEVVIDLTDVTFLDSTGMRILLTAQRTAGEQGVPLRVTGARGGVVTVLAVTGLLDLLSGHDPLPPAT